MFLEPIGTSPSQVGPDISPLQNHKINIYLIQTWLDFLYHVSLRFPSTLRLYLFDHLSSEEGGGEMVDYSFLQFSIYLRWRSEQQAFP